MTGNGAAAGPGGGSGLTGDLAGLRRVLALVGIAELWLAVAAFAAVVLLTIVQVGLRYFFEGSLWWAQEVSQMMILVAYFQGIAYAFKTRQYIVINFLADRLSRAAQLCCYLFAQLLVVVFCGVVPGVIIGIVTMAFISFYVRRKRTAWGQPEPFRLAAVWQTFRRGVLALISPAIIIGAIIGGISTPSEVGAIAAAYALVVGLIYRELSWSRLRVCLIESVTMTAVIMYLIAVSSIMGWVITTERVAHDAAALIATHIQSPLVGLLLINVFLLVVGMFLETLPALLIMSSILLPVTQALGVDPVHFGIIICFNLILGIITPPMGIGLFVAARVARVAPEQVLRAILPFLVPLVAGLLVITAFPQLTLWLPNLVFGPSF